MSTERYLVEVDQHFIDNGVRSDESFCPIAQAIDAQCEGRYWAFVIPNETELRMRPDAKDKDGNNILPSPYSIWLKNSQAVHDWMDDYDMDANVQPISLVVDIDDAEVRFAEPWPPQEEVSE